MWQLKEFRKKEAMNKWIKSHKRTCQIVEVFINNGYALEWRKLRRVY